MRRTEREVTCPEEVAEIMGRCQVLRLALPGEPAPYLLPVNFGMEADGNILYFHGATEGEKYRFLRSGCRAGFEMDCTYGIRGDPGGSSAPCCMKASWAGAAWRS